jgi:hypothetical protein
MTVLALPTLDDLAVLIASKNMEIRSDMAGGFRLFKKVRHLQEYLGDYPDLITLWKAVR